MGNHRNSSGFPKGLEGRGKKGGPEAGATKSHPLTQNPLKILGKATPGGGQVIKSSLLCLQTAFVPRLFAYDNVLKWGGTRKTRSLCSGAIGTRRYAESMSALNNAGACPCRS